MHKFIFTLLLVSLMVPLASFAESHEGEESHEAEESHEGSERVFEMRTYIAAEGRLDDLLARFRNHTNYIFVKHGMQLIGYWTPTEGDGAGNTLVYMLAHKSREAAKESWAAFGADPDWKKAAADSQKNGKLVTGIEEQWLKPTDFSPLH